jgi:hypothetical protein
MATITGQAASVSRVRTVAVAGVAPPAQRITIGPDPFATAGDQAAYAAVAVPAPSNYVTVPGLISGIYE